MVSLIGYPSHDYCPPCAKHANQFRQTHTHKAWHTDTNICINRWKQRRKRTKQKNVCWLSERCSQARNRFHFADCEHSVGISAVGCAAYIGCREACPPAKGYLISEKDWTIMAMDSFKAYFVTTLAREHKECVVYPPYMWHLKGRLLTSSLNYKSVFCIFTHISV